MTEIHLNDCLLLHVHKDIIDAINLKDIAKSNCKVERSKYLAWHLSC